MFLIAICRQSGDKWQSKTLFLTIFYLRFSINVFACRLPSVKLTENDCCEWKLKTVDPQERSTWRSGVRSAMHEASQLFGRGPTDVKDAPAPAC